MSGKPGQCSVFWTAEELAILRREYPTGGYKAVLAELPTRNEWQIRSAAFRYGLRIEGRSYVKQPTTEWIDAAIMRAYRQAPGRPNLKALAKALNRTPGWIKWRAQALGVARYGAGTVDQPIRYWTPEEIAHLERCLERGLSITSIQSSLKRAGWQRSLGAIYEYLAKRSLQIERGWWTARETAQMLGVDDKVVRTWIDKGWLKATKKHGPTVDPQDTAATYWAITPQRLRKFLIQYPRAWDHRRVRIEVLLDLLCADESLGGLGGFAVVESARSDGHG